MGAFDFGEEETLNTIHLQDEGNKSVCNTFLVDEQLMYTVETNNPDVMEPDKMDANMRAKDHNMQIDFGDFSMNLNDDTEEKRYASEYSSAVIGISLCTLDKRLNEMSSIEVDVDSWGDMDLAFKISKSTRVEDEKSMDATMDELKKDMEEAITSKKKEEVDEYEDVRDTMEDDTATATPPPEKQALSDNGNTSAQPNNGQLNRTSTATSNSFGSPNNSLGDTENHYELMERRMKLARQVMSCLAKNETTTLFF